MAKKIKPPKKNVTPTDDLNTQNRAIKKVIKALEKKKIKPAEKK